MTFTAPFTAQLTPQLPRFGGMHLTLTPARRNGLPRAVAFSLNGQGSRDHTPLSPDPERLGTQFQVGLTPDGDCVAWAENGEPVSLKGNIAAARLFAETARLLDNPRDGLQIKAHETPAMAKSTLAQFMEAAQQFAPVPQVQFFKTPAAENAFLNEWEQRLQRGIPLSAIRLWQELESATGKTLSETEVMAFGEWHFPNRLQQTDLVPAVEKAWVEHLLKQPAAARTVTACWEALEALTDGAVGEGTVRRALALNAVTAAEAGSPFPEAADKTRFLKEMKALEARLKTLSETDIRAFLNEPPIGEAPATGERPPLLQQGVQEQVFLEELEAAVRRATGNPKARVTRRQAKTLAREGSIHLYPQLWKISTPLARILGRIHNSRKDSAQRTIPEISRFFEETLRALKIQPNALPLPYNTGYRAIVRGRCQYRDPHPLLSKEVVPDPAELLKGLHQQGVRTVREYQQHISDIAGRPVEYNTVAALLKRFPDVPKPEDDSNRWFPQPKDRARYIGAMRRLFSNKRYGLNIDDFRRITLSHLKKRYPNRPIQISEDAAYMAAKAMGIPLASKGSLFLYRDDERAFEKEISDRLNAGETITTRGLTEALNARTQALYGARRQKVLTRQGAFYYAQERGWTLTSLTAKLTDAKKQQLVEKLREAPGLLTLPEVAEMIFWMSGTRCNRDFPSRLTRENGIALRKSKQVTLRSQQEAAAIQDWLTETQSWAKALRANALASEPSPPGRKRK